MSQSEDDLLYQADRDQVLACVRENSGILQTLILEKNGCPDNDIEAGLIRMCISILLAEVSGNQDLELEE